MRYYRAATASVPRADGDWEGWLDFFLDGVATLADEAVATSTDLFTRVAADRERVIQREEAGGEDRGLSAGGLFAGPRQAGKVVWLRSFAWRWR